MVCIYIHIPFCEKKCTYCDFFIFPLENYSKKLEIFNEYSQSLINQIELYWNKLWKIKVSTIYFWWWTPLLIWENNILKIINKIENSFCLDTLQELSFEINPYPISQIKHTSKTIFNELSQKYKLRFSIGIQSFDSEILKNSKRQYELNELFDFLIFLKQFENTTFNFDFIAFWNKNFDINLFKKFINLNIANSLSIYILEKNKWSFVFNKNNFEKVYWFWYNENNIWNEFDQMKKLMYENWFNRYEISNFSKKWFESIHNCNYWKMWEYLWLWMSAHWFLWKSLAKLLFDVRWEYWVRYKNSLSWKSFFWNDFLSWNKLNILNEYDYFFEKFFLWMRTYKWIEIDDPIKKIILIKDYEKIIYEYENIWLLKYEKNNLCLKDDWMDKYNFIISSILK